MADKNVVNEKTDEEKKEIAEKIKAQKRSVRNIYDGDTGLPIRVNLYIIKYIYYHINKASCFIEEKKEGKKSKSYEIYGNELPMSRQRFDRINKGERFEISSSEVQGIIERYGIDTQYFRKEIPIMFELDGITASDWKAFYSNNHPSPCNDISVKGISEKDKKDSAEKVKEALKKLVSNNWENEIDKKSPLYNICFYFQYGYKWGTEDNVEQLRKILKRMDYTEWDNVELSLLKDDYNLLKKHYTYIQSIIVMDKLQKEKKEKE